MGRGRKRKVSDEKARNFYLLYLSVKNKIRLDRPITEEAEIEMLEFEEKRFTPKDCKKDDFLKTKQLVLKTK